MKRRGIIIFLILAVLQCVEAQSARTYLRNFSASDQNDHLGVTVSFNIGDALSNPLDNFNLSDAELVVDGQTYHAEPYQPQTPFYVVLSVDISGSMTKAYRQVVTMASDIAQSAPDQGMFALQSFHKTFSFDVGFTKGMEGPLQQMSKLRPIDNSGTCVFDALIAALDLVNAQGMEGRRAVIVMTDGVDRLPTGAGCSRATPDDVILKARSIAPLYIIAVDGEQGLNSFDLMRIAQQSNGAYFDNTALDVAGRLQTVMNVLRLQWYAQFATFPTQGSHEATLRFSNNESTPVVFTISSPRTYEQPFALCSLNDKFTFDAARKVMLYPLCVQGAGRIGSLKAGLIDTQTDNAVMNSERLITDYQSSIEFDGKALGLKPGQRYAMSLSGSDIQGQPLFEEPVVIEFTYADEVQEPDAPKLEVNSFTRAGNSAVLTLNITGGMESITKIEVLRNDQSGDLALLSTISTVSTPLAIPIDLAGLTPSASYTFIVRAKDEQGRTIGEVDHAFDMPALVVPGLDIVNVVQDGQDAGQALVIQLASQNIPAGASSTVHLRQQQSTKSLVPDASYPGVPSKISLPISTLTSGDYELIIQVTDSAGNMLVTANPYPVPISISFSFPYQLLMLFRSPVFIALILVMIAFCVYAFLRLSRGHSLLPQRKTPTKAIVRHQTDNMVQDDSSLTISHKNPIKFQEMLAARSVPLAQIEILHSRARQGETVQIKSSPYIVGRLYGNLRIDDQYISSKHTEIVVEHDMVLIYNHSRNGTRVGKESLLNINSHTKIPREHNHTVEIYLPNPGGVILRLTIL